MMSYGKPAPVLVGILAYVTYLHFTDFGLLFSRFLYLECFMISIVTGQTPGQQKTYMRSLDRVPPRI